VTLFHAKGFRRALAWWPTSEIAIQNRLSIEMRERALSTEEMACKALTCAIYTLCYAKSMEESRKTGFLIHPYLRYVRVLRSGHYDVTVQPAGSNKVPPSISLPWLHLSRLGQMHHGNAETETFRSELSWKTE
jgi:hypothetical protein